MMVIITNLRVFDVCIILEKLMEPFTYPSGTEVVVWTRAFSNDRTTNDYIRPDPIFQTDDQLVYTILFRDADSTTPITSDYEGQYKCIISSRSV